MKSIALYSASLFLAATLVAAQDPVGPLTTNNAQSACVQYGDCESSLRCITRMQLPKFVRAKTSFAPLLGTSLPAGNTAATATQLSPVTPPASSVRTIAPTDASGSSASISALASQGAGAAYSSLLANGQGGGNGVGDTSIRLTAPVSAVSSSQTAGSTGGGQPAGNAAGPSNTVGSFQWLPVTVAAFFACVGGAAVLL